MTQATTTTVLKMQQMYGFAFCFRSCIILVRTPPLGTRQPHASIRKLESTPTPTGYVETLTPASRPHKRRLKHMQRQQPIRLLMHRHVQR